ncbi:MAG: DNA replication terminus site-binding protein [Candidatus Contendobacter odensis]|uniref:DNA replication terminus site-binding protein n=1 Tax=Candidatus Contendibacter odensensis TaxID=1400860 RepID=A0A2G6PE46_9GAMM|nr:MAG: DNA replication terminus site-binding protein [Candidatus Contendobacter odensis]
MKKQARAATLVTLQMDLLERFDALINSLNECCTAVRQDAALQVWVSRTELELTNHVDMREKAIDLYRALWYEASQDGRETLTCPGIVGASVATLAAAHACNIAKENFKASVLALKVLARTQTNEVMADLFRRSEKVAMAMQRMGAARLNLKQAYRHIPLLDRCPLKVGFTWSKRGRVIQRTSVATARQLLEKRIETPQTRLELQRLAKIAEDEMLARVRSVCPHLRANVVFADLASSNGVQRRLMQAPLPILVPLEGESFPEFVPVPPDPPLVPRLRRADVRIEDDPFLPLVRVYRYRSEYR